MISRSTVASSLLLATIVVGLRPAHAGSGAELLLKNLKGQSLAGKSGSSGADGAKDAPITASKSDEVSLVHQFKLDDSFTIEFFTAWNGARSRLSPEVNHWAQLYLKAEFEQVLHLWDGIEPQVPAGFRDWASGARIASLARLGLLQSMVEEWIAFLRMGGTGGSAALERELPGFVAPGLGWDRLLADRGILLGPEAVHEISQMDPRKGISIVSLQAYGALRKGEQGRGLLPLLSNDHVLKLPLAQTVALAQARRGDLARAATTLKEHAEPALEKQKDLTRVSSYLLQISRFLFQAGMWDEAESYLRKIPTSAPEFLVSREELAWILLRKGDVSALRGEIASLSTDASGDAFQPELPVVRAISNLKLCSYGAVQKDFELFSSRYGAWARRIDAALASSSAIPPPASADAFSRQASLGVSSLQSESEKVSELHLRSLRTSIPSVVGRQGHWKRLESKLTARLELARKLEQAEFGRQWRNQRTMLSEAIRKLRFVKIELIHQMRIAEAEARKGMDVLAGQQASALRSGDRDLVFPLDGVLWPDEFFKIQSLVESRCLRGGGSK